MRARNQKNQTSIENLLENLENRRMLAATVSLLGSTLTIQGDATAQNVEIHESRTGTVRQTRIAVDADGNGSFADAGDTNGVYTGVTRLVVRLGQASDSLKITLADPMDGVDRSYDLKTNGGNDTVVFSSPIGNDIRNSTVGLSVDTGNGNDNVTLNLNRIANSALTANILTGSGNDTVQINAGGVVSTSTVALTASLGDGADSLNQRFDWEGFDLLATSTWRVLAYGGEGNDSLGATGELGSSSADVAGTLDLGLYGEGGDDQIAFALDRFNLKGGTLKLRGNGSIGNDVLTLAGRLESGGVGGLLDIVLRGGAGNDTLISSANSNALNRYTSAAGATLDGGTDIDTVTATGTLLATRLNAEA